MSLFLSLENKDFDLNSLFNITHSFEILKQVLQTIAISNKKINHEVSVFKEDAKLKDDLIKDLVSQLNLEKANNRKFIEVTDNNFSMLTNQIVSLTNGLNALTEAVGKTAEVPKIKNDLLVEGIKDTLSKNLKSIEAESNEETKKFEKKHTVMKDQIIKKKDKEKEDLENKEKRRLNELEKQNKNKKTEIVDNKNNTNNNSNINTNNTNTKDKDTINSLNKKTSKINNNDFSLNDSNNNDSNQENTNNKLKNIKDLSKDNTNSNNKDTKNNLNTNQSNSPQKTENNEINDYNNDNNDLNRQITIISNFEEYNNKPSEERINKLGQNQFKLEENITKLLKRIDRLERELDDTKFSTTNNNPNSDQANIQRRSTSKLLELVKVSEAINSQIEEIKLRVVDLEVQNSRWEEKINDLSIKSQDMDIYDALKSGGENTNLDQTLILVQSLEKKVFKKFEFSDEKQKRLEEEQGKIRNEASKTNKKVEDVNNENKTNSTVVDRLVNDVEKLFKLAAINSSNSSGDINRRLSSVNSDEMDQKINEKINEIKNYDFLNHNLDKLKNIISKTMEERVIEQIAPFIDGETLKLRNEINKKTSELDKQMKVMSANINIERVNGEIVKINENLMRKINLEDFSELKSNVNLVSHQVTYLKETLSQVVDDRKVLDDIAWLRKKVENLTSSMLSFKVTDDPGMMNSKGGGSLDTSKYLEGAAFNAFHKNYTKDIEYIRGLIDDNKKDVSELNDKLKQRVSDEDMKNLEEYLVNRLEETRISLSKKFADKIDTQKSIKYVEAQIKHVVEVYVKKMEKGDNWMLAKKPVNGYSCASCENYIGELNDKAGDFTAWNKYPARETTDKAYKMGNGFSRMLQMLNVDLKRTYKDDADLTDGEMEDFRRSQVTKRKQILPEISKEKLTKNSKDKHVDGNTSADNLMLGDDHQIKSKVVKIYKKKVNS